MADHPVQISVHNTKSFRKDRGPYGPKYLISKDKGSSGQNKFMEGQRMFSFLITNRVQYVLALTEVVFLPDRTLTDLHSKCQDVRAKENRSPGFLLLSMKILICCKSTNHRM